MQGFSDTSVGPAMPYMPGPEGLAAGPPSPSSIGPQLRDTIQQIVTQIAESILVARRVLDVVQADETLPTRVELGDARSTSDDGVTLFERRAAAQEAATMFTAEFGVDLATAEALAGRSGPAGLPKAAQATRKLVEAEDGEVLTKLIAGGRNHDAQADLFAAATALRGAGHNGPLAAIVRPDYLESGTKSGEMSGLRRLFAEGILAGPADMEVGAMALAPGSWNAHILVGQNYAVDWLGIRGDEHQVTVAVSLLTVVVDDTAICLVGR